jgi:hypothetical protein
MSDIDALVDRAVAAVSTIARRGSTLTTGVAIVAALVFGAAYLVGLGAFGGTTRTVWAVVGGALLLVAVGAPLVASFRLRSIPKKANSLVGELRALIDRDESARRVIIDTVLSEDGSAEPSAADSMDARRFAAGGFAAGGFGSARTPQVVMQFQRFSQLRSFATSDDVKNLAGVAQTVGSLPGLVSAGILLTGLGAILGFIFTLIWIF